MASTQNLMALTPVLINSPMFFWLLRILTAVIAYLIGSINFGIIVSRHFHKQDVRELGSGNSGMTNVLRNFGKASAVITLVGDMGKGVLSVWVGRWLFMLIEPGTATLYGAYIAAVFTVIGHLFPVFHKFRGGKGVATSGGVILALQPFIALSLIGVFLIVALTTKMVSLGSVIGISLYPVVTLVYTLVYLPAHVVFCTICAAIISGLIVWAHRANIQRIRTGTENKIGSKKKQAPPENK